MFTTITHYWLLQRCKCSICPMQLKAEADPYGIQASINLMSIALHCICVGCEVVNNANGYRVLEVPNTIFLCWHRWKLLLHKIKIGVRHCSGQLDYHHCCSWYVMTIWLLYPILCDVSVPFTMMDLKLNIRRPVRSNYGNIQHPQHAHFCWLSVDAILLHHLKFVMVWLCGCQHVFSQCSSSIYNIVVHDDCLHWGWLIMS